MEEELNRVLPAVRAVRELSHDIFISIDTRKSAVAEEALKLGADIVNDVSGFLFDPGLAEVTARYDAGAIIMHSRATPDRMQAQENLHYSGGLIETVIEELRIMVDNVLKAGVRRDAIILDPGIGFAKTAEQSAALINEAEKLLKLGYRADYPGTCCFTAGLRDLRFHDSLRRERLRDHPDPQCQSGKRCFESLLQLHGNEKQREITEKTAEATHVRGGEFIAYLLRSWSSISQNPQKAREFLKNFIFFMNSPEKNTDRNPCFQDCGLFV